jgi:hypothetical protein
MIVPRSGKWIGSCFSDRRRGRSPDRAADAAIKERRLEHVHRAAMARFLEFDDLRDLMARRDLYRRCSRMGEAAVDVAERVLYADIKER